MLKSFAPPLVPASPAVTVQEIASSRPGGDTVYNTSIAASPAPRSAWIVSPVIDFLFGCGGLVWILFLLHYYFLNGSGTGTIAEALIITSSLGAVCLSETHTAATLVAGFRHAKSPGLLRSALYLMAALSLALAVFGIALPGAASILVKVYLLIIPHHFMSQSYGVAVLYCMKAGYSLNPWERRVLLCLVRSVTVFAVLRQLTFKEFSGATFLMQPVPFWGPLPQMFVDVAQMCLTGSALSFCALILIRLLQNRQMFPFAAQLTLASAITAFVLDPFANTIYWLYVSAFMHGSQYLMIVFSKHLQQSQSLDHAWLCQKKDNLHNQKLPSLLLWVRNPIVRLIATISLITSAIYFVAPGILQTCGFAYATATASIFAAFNFFHIITDGLIWRLRNRKLRETLVS